MAKTVSIGICAYNEVERISGLLDSLVEQALPDGFEVIEILVVASGCTDGTERIVEERAKAEPRLVAIRERQRRGKSFALNEILGRFRGDILVLVNADAYLRSEALHGLLEVFDGNDQVDLACGFPSPRPSTNVILDAIERVWWRLHNRTLQTLSDAGGGNHCCDELMAMKRGFVTSIPKDIVNDGSYFGTLAALRGTTVRFCPRAIVVVETPSTIFGLLRQRRRIVTGHRQVARLLGKSPFTLEGLAREQPALAARILGSELADRPIETLLFLVLAGSLEILSHVLSLVDRTRGRGYGPAWPVVE